MIGTLSNLGRAQKLMRETDIDAARIAALADIYGFRGLSESTICRALKTGKLSRETDESLGELVRRVEKLIADAAPIAISFANAEKVAQLISDLESRRTVLVVLTGLQPGSQE